MFLIVNIDITRRFIRLFISFVFIILSVSLVAQQPTDQDCLGAITVCQSVYTQPNSYSGTGNYPNEIPSGGGGCPGNCMLSGEKNDIWYIFTVNTGGDLGFTITPFNSGDDYDWVVYSLNEFDCEDIYSHVGQMQVSCNWSGNPGTTGATLTNGSNCQNAGEDINIAYGATAQLDGTVDGGSGNFLFDWQPEEKLEDNTVEDPTTINLTETTNYTMLVEDESSNCQSTDEVIVNIVGGPMSISIVADNNFVCAGAPAVIEVVPSGGNGDITVPNPKTTILNENQIYLLNVVDDNGCIGESSEVTIQVTGSALGAQPISIPSKICIGQTATLISNVSGGGGGPYTIEWRTEDGSWAETGDNVLVNPTEDTKYFLKVNDGYTIKDSITLYLAVNPLPEINLIPTGYPYSGDTISVCVRDTVTLDAGNENNPPDMAYQWSNGWGDRYFTTGTNGNQFDFQSFSVTTTNNVTGCEDNSSISIRFDFTECAIGIGENNNTSQPLFIYPNPNNGFFQLSTMETITSLEIELADLNGKILFRNHYTNINPAGWTSDINITKLPEGIYLLKYKADSKSYSQKILKIKSY